MTNLHAIIDFRYNSGRSQLNWMENVSKARLINYYSIVAEVKWLFLMNYLHSIDLYGLEFREKGHNL